MKRFTQLIEELDESTKTNDKVSSLKSYFDETPDKDKVWTIALLSGKRPRRTISASFLREWAAEKANLPQWLFEECYHVVGDLSETIALLLPETSKINKDDNPLHFWIEKLVEAKDSSEEEKKYLVTGAWAVFNKTERFVFNKLLTGGFRIGVSKKLMIKALAKHIHSEEDILSHYLMGDWDPFTIEFDQLIHGDHTGSFSGKPYPFYLLGSMELKADF